MYRVVTSYPDGTREQKRELPYRAAQHEAASIRQDYKYSNGGAKCLRLAPHAWMLGDLPGPRATVAIKPEVRCSTINCGKPATHEVTYTMRDDRTRMDTDPCCQECGEAYLRRPTLLARLAPMTERDAFTGPTYRPIS
jgi:hypothetical protein